MRDCGLHRLYHGIAGENGPNLVEPMLLLVGIGALPCRKEPRDRSRIHIGSSADAARGTVTQTPQQERLTPRQDVETLLRKVVDVRSGVFPIAGGILGPRNDAGILL